MEGITVPNADISEYYSRSGIPDFRARIGWDKVVVSYIKQEKQFRKS